MKYLRTTLIAILTFILIIIDRIITAPLIWLEQPSLSDLVEFEYLMQKMVSRMAAFVVLVVFVTAIVTNIYYFNIIVHITKNAF